MWRGVGNKSDRRPKWAAALYHEIQRMIGQQLKLQLALPQELPPDMSAQLTRMDQQGATKSENC
jgi:hypothetical protein